MSKRIILSAFDMASSGHLSPGLWRYPGDRTREFTSLQYWIDLARLLEDGGFDGLFFADGLGIYEGYRGNADAALAQGAQFPIHDPLVIVSAMAAATKRLGFGVTVNTNNEHPFIHARTMSTLDHATDGRIGWNIVTSFGGRVARTLAPDFSVPQEKRYDRAEEFIEVCYRLWEASWDDDATVAEPEGRLIDPARVHEIEYTGEFFNIRDYSRSQPSPQRTPVIFQAGMSQEGRSYAARHAEGVFVGGASPESVAPVVDDVRERARRFGRNPDDLKFLNLLTVVADESDTAAWAKYEQQTAYIDHEAALALFAGWSGTDLSRFAPDEPLPVSEMRGSITMVDAIPAADPERGVTPRDVARSIGIGGAWPVTVGGPQTVADELDRWVELGGVDGFNIADAVSPGSMADFIAHVVPELRRRGRIPSDPQPGTFREALYGPGHRLVRPGHPAYQHRDEREQRVTARAQGKEAS